MKAGAAGVLGGDRTRCGLYLPWGAGHRHSPGYGGGLTVPRPEMTTTMKPVRYVTIVADGGGGWLPAAIFASVLPAEPMEVMIGSPFARAAEAPGRGIPLGHGHPQPGPASGHSHQGRHHRKPWSKFCEVRPQLDDGTHNLLGALQTSMGTLGAKDLKEMQQVEVVIAPSLLTEGKVYQKAQQLGMGK